jgi:hypothetical protein
LRGKASDDSYLYIQHSTEPEHWANGEVPGFDVRPRRRSRVTIHGGSDDGEVG